MGMPKSRQFPSEHTGGWWRALVGSRRSAKTFWYFFSLKVTNVSEAIDHQGAWIMHKLQCRAFVSTWPKPCTAVQAESSAGFCIITGCRGEETGRDEEQDWWWGTWSGAQADFLPVSYSRWGGTPETSQAAIPCEPLSPSLSMSHSGVYGLCLNSEMHDTWQRPFPTFSSP